jgi:CubicO group peptidase (beta-lactamase class C family)
LVFLALSLILARTAGAQDAEATGSRQHNYIAPGEYKGSYWPTGEWRTCTPETVGMDSGKLSKAVEYAATPEFNTEGVVVIKDGYIVAEAYFGSFRRDSEHVSHSMAKSFTSALIGIAIEQGLITGIDERLSKYYDGWRGKGDLRSGITIRHAMTLTTGLKWHEEWTKWDPSTNDALKMGGSGYFIRYMAARPGLHEPGQQFVYSTGDPMLLSLVIQKATGMTAFDYAKKHIFDPLNFSKIRWDQDQDGYTATAWGLWATVRDYAKFGYLYLNDGRWEDRQLVPEKWVEQSTRTDPTVKMWKAYGYLWHVNLPLRLEAPESNLPSDSFMAEGVQGQNIFIFPSSNLVIVKVAEQREAHLDMPRFLGMIIDSIR